MSKYLNVFNTLAEYQAFSASTEYVQPNVALVKENNVLYYDYGDNKPQVDMSSYKGEFQEKSVGGDNFGRDAITKINYIPSGVTSLDNAFSSHYSLEEITCKIPDSVTSMYNTFSWCPHLVNAPSVMPNSVTNMNSTFAYCGNLITAPSVIPDSVTNMESTFSNCGRLITAPSVIPNSVTNMEQTFAGCESLITAPSVIPDSVTNMSWTFYNCKNLKEATFLHTTPPTYSYTLKGCSKLETIYVPDEAVDAYKTATGWSEFASKFKPLSEKPTE